MLFKGDVPGGRRRAPRCTPKPGLLGAALLAALIAAIAVPAVLANAGDPGSTQSSWAAQDMIPPSPASSPAMTVMEYERIGDASFTRGPITAAVGDRVDFQVVVQDTGATSLDVSLSDLHCEAGTISPSGTATMRPGDTQTFTCSHVVQSGDQPTLTNVATATAGVPGASSQTTGTISGSSSVDTNIDPPAAPATPQPDVNIVKLERIGVTGGFVQGPTAGHVGDTVFYEILVTNPSADPYTLTVSLSDPRCDANTLAPSSVVTLAPGQEQTYTCSHLLVAGDQPQFTNTATAAAGPLNSPASVHGVTRSASAVANVGPAAQVKGVTKTITRKAKPAPKQAVVKAASFTG